MELWKIFLFSGLGLSFFLLFTRKKKWNSDLLRWGITGGLFVIGIAGFIIEKMSKTDYGFSFLCTPMIYNCFDRWFKYLSIKKYGRDFYLWLRHSDEIDYGIGGVNPHVKALDKLFSILLLFIITGLMLLPILILRFNNK